MVRSVLITQNSILMLRLRKRNTLGKSFSVGFAISKSPVNTITPRKNLVLGSDCCTMELTTNNLSDLTFRKELYFLRLVNILRTFSTMTTLVVILLAPRVYLTFCSESHTMQLSASNLLNCHPFARKVFK